MKKESPLESLHYSIYEEWIKGGKKDVLPEEMVDYVKHLTAVLGYHTRGFTEKQITPLLMETFQLSYSAAKSRYVDAINHFYLDNDIKYEAHMQSIVERFKQIAATIYRTATSPDEMVLAVKPLKEAALILEKIKPKELVPEDLFDKPNKIYTFKPEDVGLLPANRNEIAKLVEKMQLEEVDKIEILKDADVEPQTLFRLNEQED